MYCTLIRTPNAQTMTKILLSALSVMLTLQALSQNTVTSKPVLPASTADASAKILATAVVSRFHSEMNLNADQKAKVAEIISNYLDEKAKIIPLATENKTAYDDKQASYFKTLRVKLKDVLVRTQWQKFMSLKPKPSETDSSLYYVYY